MIKELPDPAKTVVAAAGFTGLGKSELRGLDWLDYRDGALHVSRSVWRSHVGEPKTPRRRAAVPVIPLLAETLDEHRKGWESGPVFRGLNGQPLSLDNLVTRIIKPTLRLSGLKWRGWHAFRRGLATNLKRLGVDDKTIQRILRHSDVTTTQNIYIQTAPADAVAAMELLERAVRDRVRPN
jgi:integrase